MDGMVTRVGGCRCGRVRYEVRGEPIKVGLCHCTDCRKETGSAFLYYADWEIDRFSVTGDFNTMTVGASVQNAERGCFTSTTKGLRFASVVWMRRRRALPRHAKAGLRVAKSGCFPWAQLSKPKPIHRLAVEMTSDAIAAERVATWTLPYGARLGSSVRSQGLYMQVRSHLPKALQKSLTVKAGELTLRMPDSPADEFEAMCAIIAEALLVLESRPVIPREIEDILGISSTERRRWLEDGRLPSAGTRTTKLRGRGAITFHVFDPEFVADVLSRDLVIEWREKDTEVAAERRRQAAWKSRQKRLQGAGVSENRIETTGEKDDGGAALRGWEEFAKTGLP